MLYHFLYPLSAELPLLNVFRYITFRSVWALLTALLITIFIGPRFIRWLKRVKCGQYIQEEVSCHVQKAGTPTMGGLLIGFSLIISVLLWGDLTNVYLWLVMLVFTGFGLVGFLDDYTKLRRKTNQGLTARSKFLWQMVIAAVAMYFLVKEPAYSTVLSFPFFKNLQPDLGWFYIPFAMIVLVGSSNGVNLTDGMDGLAIGPTVVAGIVFSIFIYIAGHSQIAGYLQVPYVPGMGEVTVFCGALIGAGLGFLWFNAYPAQVFMGDVGSLSLGGALGFLAVLCKQELIMLVAGGLFVLESLSVILQVGYFRMTGGKRIFRMAPLHHHFELKGIPESKIIIRFWIMSIVFGLMALSVLKLR
ncbi:phospho-N-acetylmuramoyl-pentapeptide-transferase [Oleidesulfovibrio alaskensis G20]|jgi:phospho-N-acetylmuramoyl-pentapeptide-transferase|uniref:Phospho-N-acetylmuramoyl-pentapeptide-transferase n=1 Tax=Oleidesulfovibrio alaskensis (strain ATCC BAA-1058 / DSM 17464 / G20) TaxID=207559 RepID=MRAY_OLEA2|nr:phospho-N-acetylmuramoyl-pentapeptide-transferase [Oleidesulfovibrio alaskensis]Q313Q6.1 RecName: Full=Phospho-N-acetylmuramoyl-pentapeptide-transferase; AltName: Full=UDP-MurNAc-pentapeptide phosphotransferase [Oleidesulfovibrio alaskensis G20]ABB37840.1 phospho-N-acetylmuramoyl-pentapeptide-transferase [Oleidesulfovibrio alaskensis G20]MBG0773701.1 phospho-N-acetylmuramoyl-pentapeptide-transferase [Oleidesulfovibrio alaskensis]MBL3582448.1 phospho-N-acetylmuramoyl-pentapeptide-transferase 